MQRDEKMEFWWKRFNKLAAIDRKRYFDDCDIQKYGRWPMMWAGGPPISVHFGMFVQALNTLTTDKQREKWLPRAKALNIIGCYAQTELGHGSNASDLETTATLDLEKDQWVINTPTITATKFWPGTMGLMANHAIVFARCITNGTDNGIAPFFV